MAAVKWTAQKWRHIKLLYSPANVRFLWQFYWTNLAYFWWKGKLQCNIIQRFYIARNNGHMEIPSVYSKQFFSQILTSRNIYICLDCNKNLHLLSMNWCVKSLFHSLKNCHWSPNQNNILVHGWFFENCNAYGTKYFHKLLLASVGNGSQYS